MQFIETPPPSLLRARFATVLDHLPSVPTVVLPILSLVETDRALSSFKARVFCGSIRQSQSVQSEPPVIAADMKIKQTDLNQPAGQPRMTNSVIFRMTNFVQSA